MSKSGNPETPTTPPTPQEIQQNVSSQVNITIIVIVSLLALVMVVLASKMFRTYITLHRLEAYKSKETHLKNIDNESDKLNEIILNISKLEKEMNEEI